MVVPLAKRRKDVNGHKLGDRVKILEVRAVPDKYEVREIRIL
jgi:hypothetical protein